MELTPSMTREQGSCGISCTVCEQACSTGRPASCWHVLCIPNLLCALAGVRWALKQQLEQFTPHLLHSTIAPPCTVASTQMPNLALCSNMITFKRIAGYRQYLPHDPT